MNIKNFVAIIVGICVSIVLKAGDRDTTKFVDDKTAGLLYGSALGDSYGGPIEFKSHKEIQQLEVPTKHWKEGEFINDEELGKAKQRLVLRDYRPLRPEAEPYGHWTFDPGAVTDDTRHKMILMQMLRESLKDNEFQISDIELAHTYLEWPVNSTKDRYREITAEWLDESYKGIRWLLGSRDLEVARPLERLWNGVPTSYGQMSLLPIAALYPGDAENAYLSAYKVAFFDNSWGRDMNASLVVGLSEAMIIDMKECTPAEAWARIYKVMVDTDPYGFGEIPWMKRSTEYWLNEAKKMVTRAKGEPAELFAEFDKAFARNMMWEAHVPFVLCFASLEMCNYDPLAALAFCMDWGQDHDSYAQLLGAFVGALYGTSLFDDTHIKSLENSLNKDYGESIEEWCEVLEKLRNKIK